MFDVALTVQSIYQQLRWGKPFFKQVNKSTSLRDLVGSESHFLFQVLGITNECLAKTVDRWPEDPNFHTAERFVNTAKVANEKAERVVDFATGITNPAQLKAVNCVLCVVARFRVCHGETGACHCQHSRWRLSSSLSLPSNDGIYKTRQYVQFKEQMRLFGYSVILLLIFPVEEVPAPGCKLELQEVIPFSMDGDFVLGVVSLAHTGVVYPALNFRGRPLPARCKEFQVRYYRDLVAILFAIEEINQDKHLLPNHTLGFWIVDSCTSEVMALQGTLQIVSGGNRVLPNYMSEAHPNLAGILGEIFSSLSEIMARISGVYRIPQISFASQHPMLSDKIQFPSFLRTFPSGFLQPQAFAQLLRHFNWTWVGILSSNIEVTYIVSRKIQQAVEENGGCVAFMEKISDRFPSKRLAKVMGMILQSSASVIVCNCYDMHLKPFLELLSRHNVTGIVWVFSIDLTINPYLFTKESWRLFNGSLVFTGFTTDMPHFIDFFYNIRPSAYPKDTFTKLFWEKAFECQWEGQNVTHTVTGENVICTGEEDLKALDLPLFRLNDLSIAYHAYLAVYAYAHALYNMTLDRSKDDTFGTTTDMRNIKPWQVLHYLRSVHFSTEFEENVFFDANGDVPAIFDIMNIQILPDDTSKLVKVGIYDSRKSPGEELFLNITAIRWNQNYNQIPVSVCSVSCPVGYRKSARLGQPSCCFDCVPCSSGQIANETDTGKCRKCPEDQWPNESRDKCIPKIIEFLSYQEPLGVALAVVALILSVTTALILAIFFRFQNTPVVKANNRGLSYLLLCSLILCFLCSLTFIGLPAKLTCMIRQPAFGLTFTISVSCILAKTVTVVIAFKAIDPHNHLRRWIGQSISYFTAVLCSLIQLLICLYWISNHPSLPENSSRSGSGKMIIECNDGSTILFYCMLGYVGFLAIISFIVAFLARTLPDSFNEAKFITFSMLVFVSVWLSFIPAYLSTHGKYMVAVEIFAILSSAAGLLFLIFFPKCYIILLRPEMNTKEHLVGKTITRK
uniref:Vomeronasal type-2 receptor 26-like n=1 Tax=Geotrypetes seraphini TaxID=260995 RepID=A0A6P8SIF1_GEOSA|nr:vomeronasal type-2 receptor 26-like [Geotrypetes seraphini]